MKSTAEVQTPAQVLDVLLGHGRHTDRHTREVDALVVADPAANDHPGVYLCFVDLGHPQADLAVVDQDLVAVADVAGQSGVRRGSDLVVPLDLARGDRERLPGLNPGRALLEAAQPDLGALQVDEDAHPVAGLVGSLAHPAVDLLVLGVAAVAEIEPGDVHPGVHQLSDPLG